MKPKRLAYVDPDDTVAPEHDPGQLMARINAGAPRILSVHTLIGDSDIVDILGIGKFVARAHANGDMVLEPLQ